MKAVAKMRDASGFMLIALLLFSVLVNASPRPSKPNVLLIISDDYRPEGRLGLDPHMGGPLFDTPNLHNFASQSVVFDSAYATSPSCGPSRSSFLTGFRSDKLKYWSFVSPHWRETGTAWMSIPQYFKSLGYITVGIGKIFHWDDVWKDDGEFSWSQTIFTGPFAGGEQKCDDPGAYFCTCGSNCVDETLAARAMGKIDSLSNQAQPWFMALGFRRPHMDWSLPPGWVEKSGQSKVVLPMPKNRQMDPSIPDAAYYACAPLLFNSENLLPQGAWLSDGLTDKIRRYYWSTVNFMDKQLGRVLDHLDLYPKVKAKTIVIFMSDHGFSLGERSLWCKQNLFDDANRVALMFRIPWMNNGGTRVTRPVSLIDMFPTLIDLADLPPPVFAACLGGSSLFAANAESNAIAISQFPRCSAGVKQNPYSNPCMNELPQNFALMGYTIRTRFYRYTEWRRWLGKAGVADWSDQGLEAVELYDEKGQTFSPNITNDFEVVNVANTQLYKNVQSSMASQLRSAIADPNWAQRCILSDSPTPQPTTARPTAQPTTVQPTFAPTPQSAAPTKQPTRMPTLSTLNPTPRPISVSPTVTPTLTTSRPSTPPLNDLTPSPLTTPVTRTPSLPPVNVVTERPTLAPTPTRATLGPTPPPTTAPGVPSVPTLSPKQPDREVLPLKKSDLDAFKQLYDATDGPSWSSCADSRLDPCNTLVNGCDLKSRYIMCEVIDQELRLIGLSLPTNHMQGELPLAIFDLPYLMVINLANDPWQNPLNNIFTNVDCLEARRCSYQSVTCAVGNTNVRLCGTASPEECMTFDRATCRLNSQVCRFFAGGYGCKSKNFCGFKTRRFVPGPVPAALAKQGVLKGAPGCMGKDNIRRCIWRKGKCSNRWGLT